MEKYYFGTGRRKTSIAQVRVYKGTGKVVDHQGKEVTDLLLIEESMMPLKLVSAQNDYDISLKLSGGGFSSQREAARLGVARALAKINKEFKTAMQKENLLSRDPREKERKKPGLKRARRAPQWQKR
jgi:small subunit ribosomal protein S9